MAKFKHITFVGFGVMAASMAADLGSQFTLRAVTSAKHHNEILTNYLADEVYDYDQIDEWSKNTDLIVLCCPVKRNIELLKNLKKNKVTATIIDISSTKEEICKVGKDMPNFIGTHPMAGTEKHGYMNYELGMFKDKIWFVTGADENVNNFIQWFFAKPVFITAKEHDKEVAAISHLPQFISTALAGCKRVKAAKHSGNALKDMTRIAQSDYNVWKDIAFTNSKNILAEINEFQKRLTDISVAIKQKDDKKLAKLFKV